MPNRILHISFFIFFLFALESGDVSAQGRKHKPVKLKNYLSYLEGQHPVKFNYRIIDIRNKYIDTSGISDKLILSLTEIESQLSIAYFYLTTSIVVLRSEEHEGHLSFQVIDTFSKAPVAYAYVKWADNIKLTDEEGRFNIFIPPGDTASISVIAEGYISKVAAVFHQRKQPIPLYLQNKYHIDLVEKQHANKITDDRHMVYLPHQENSISIFGNGDLINTIRGSSGVQGLAETTPGLSIRGDAPENNLVLLDGAKVFNPSHLFGLLSVFHNDSYRVGDLYADYVPSNLGGNLSGALNVLSQNGNKEKWKGSAHLGLLHAGVNLNGPIIKDRWSISVSGRRSYADLMLNPFLNNANTNVNDQLRYFFYDLNLRSDFTINTRNNISFTFFNGKDVGRFKTEVTDIQFNETTEQEIGWTNEVYAFNWRSQLSERWTLKLTLASSKYDTEVKDQYTLNNFSPSSSSRFYAYGNGIRELRNTLLFIRYGNHWNLKTGAQGIQHQFNNGAQQYRISNEFTAVDTSFGRDLFTGNQLDHFTEFLYARNGLRLNTGYRVTSYITKERNPVFFEPRININYQFKLPISVYASAYKGTQFLKLIPNNFVGLPTDVWLPVGLEGEPQTSFNYLIGGQWQISPNISFKSNVFYREWLNLLEVSTQNALFFIEPSNWQSNLVSGKGEAKGIETSVYFIKNNNSLSAHYHLSKSNRRFEEINDGEWYPFRLDRRHDISLRYQHVFKNQNKLFINWIYLSGNPTSLPSTQYINVVENDTLLLQDFPEKNNFRFPAYHRLDIAFQITKTFPKGYLKWSFGVYNAYNRFNAFNLFIGVDENGNPVLKQRTYFPILPTFNVSFKLK